MEASKVYLARFLDIIFLYKLPDALSYYTLILLLPMECTEGRHPVLLNAHSNNYKDNNGFPHLTPQVYSYYINQYDEDFFFKAAKIDVCHRRMLYNTATHAKSRNTTVEVHNTPIEHHFNVEYWSKVKYIIHDNIPRESINLIKNLTDSTFLFIQGVYHLLTGEILNKRPTVEIYLKYMTINGKKVYNSDHHKYQRYHPTINMLLENYTELLVMEVSSKLCRNIN